MTREYYIDGRKVIGWYRRGQGSKATPIFENVGYHYGDLGKARDTNYFSINNSYRSTGHYGTGTYFFGRRQEKDELSFTRRDRPEHVVNFSDYNLYRPKDNEEAYILHEGLKALNYGEYDSPYFVRLKDKLIAKKKTNIEINSALSKVIKAKETLNKSSVDKQLESDSLSTTFMKELGYDGVDVRQLEDYDNSQYGSVIYNLKKK